MHEIEKPSTDFIGYEYKEVTVDSDLVSLYIDCYHNFGWAPDDHLPLVTGGRQTKIQLKRDRKILNKMELTRLQRNFEACVNEIRMLERSKASHAALWAIATGILGTFFMAGSTFAVTHQPPFIWLCIILAVPGFIGWILPYFLYRRLLQYKTKQVIPLMEQKYDEIYEVCEKGKQLI